MSITTEEMTLDKNNYLSVIVEEILEQHDIYGGERHKNKLRQWVIEKSNLFNSSQFRNYYTNNPYLPKGEKIVIPFGKLDVLEIINDVKINREEIGQDLKKEIAYRREQSIDSCICFANGGVKYEFEIKYHNNFPRVWYKKNGEEMGEFSRGKFISFRSATGNVVASGREGTFSKGSRSDTEVIEIKKITADNNRVFCYGQMKVGVKIRHRFFWAQMEDEFPAEPGGESLPGVYVRNKTTDDEQQKRYREVVEKFLNSYNEHPAWALQMLGGKLTEIINSPLMPKSIKETLNNFNTVMPVIVKKGVWYEIDLPPTTEEFKIKNVLDLGVANPHRYESYKKEIGGEVMSFLYDRKLEDYQNPAKRLTYFDIFPPKKIIGNILFKKLLWQGIPKIFPNTKVHDGMGYNDGTCNFFMLVEFEESYKGNTFGVLWCDEQEFFSQKWRLIHPDDSEYGALGIGTYTSVFPVIKWYYTNISVGQISEFLVINNRFKWNTEIYSFEAKFKASLPYDKIDKYSRISTARSATVLTTKDKIYSISSMWGVADFGWNERDYPPGQVVFPETIKFRDDSTLYMLGYYKQDDKYILGYWYQKYLPSGTLQNNYFTELYSQEPFEHPWFFVKEDIFDKLDSYYNFGIYDAYYENKGLEGEWFPFRDKENRNYYAYDGIDERSQYYKVKLLNPERLGELKDLISIEPVEWVPHNRNVYNPFFSSYTKKKDISITLRWDAVLESLIAVYTHLWDEDILVDMQDSGFLTEYFPAPFDYDLRGNWKPLAKKNEVEQDDLACIGTIYFKPNKAELRDKSQEIKLLKLATFIRRYHLNEKVKFYGHCAKVQGEVESISQALSEERAQVVYNFIIDHIIKHSDRKDKKIFSIYKRFERSGFGSELPESTNETEAGMKLNRRVEVMVETKYFYFKMIDRIRDFSPPSVKKVKLKKNGNGVDVTFTTNDDSIRYITVGAIVGDEARPISKRFHITKDTDTLFKVRHEKEKLKEKLLYIDDITSIEDLTNVREVKETEKFIKDLFDSIVEVHQEVTILDIAAIFSSGLLGVKVLSDLKDVIRKMQDKARPEPLPDPVDITVTIPLLSVGNSDALFKEDSHMLHGTSVWFEDIQGHKAIAEELEIVEG